MNSRSDKATTGVHSGLSDAIKNLRSAFPQVAECVLSLTPRFVRRVENTVKHRQ